MCLIAPAPFMVPAEVLRAALLKPISRELWALIDKHQRRELPEPKWPEPKWAELSPEQPIALVAPLTSEEAEAADQADQARLETEDKIRKMYERGAPRALNCGTYSPTIHLRRDRENGAVEDAIIRTSCGRSDCPWCWRRRLTKTYRRACACLLDTSRSSRRPRTGFLYITETTWAEWEAFDKALRRAVGGECGRLRVRRCDNHVLVVCEQPFSGSRPVTPAEALRLTSAAIGELHTARHAFRLLGRWNDSAASEWRQVAIYPKTLDFAEVRRLLEEAQHKSRLFKSSDMKGLVWRCDNEMTAANLELLIQRQVGVCPTLSSENRNPYGIKSDTLPDEGEIGDDWLNPFERGP